MRSPLEKVLNFDGGDYVCKLHYMEEEIIELYNDLRGLGFSFFSSSYSFLRQAEDDKSNLMKMMEDECRGR